MISVFLINFVSLEDCQSHPPGPDVCNSSTDPSELSVLGDLLVWDAREVLCPDNPVPMFPV